MPKHLPPYQLFLLLALLLISPYDIYAQSNIGVHPFYKHYAVDDGLPSNEVYHVFQDSKGYIWFATNNGVSRFDGQIFQNFDMADGLVDNVVFEIFEDYKGRIWFVSYSCLLCYYENDSIKQYAYNQKISNKINNVLGPVKMGFRVDSLDNILLSVKCNGILSITAEGAIRVLDEGIFSEANIVVDARNNGVMISSTRYSENQKLIYFDDDKKLSVNLESSKEKCLQQLYYATINDSTVLLSISKNFVVIKGKQIDIIKNNKLGLWLSVDNNKNLWIANFEGGIELFSNADITKPPTLKLFNESRILSALQDSDGVFWFTTQSDGVFCVPNYKVNLISKSEGLQNDRIRQVLYHDNKLYIGYEKGFVDVLHNGKISNIYNDSGYGNEFMKSFMYDSLYDGIIVSGATSIMLIKHGKSKTIKKLDTNPRAVVPSINGGYWIAHKFGIYKYLHGKQVYNSLDDNTFIADVSCILEDKKGIIWFCTIDGLWRYDGKNFQNLGENNKLLRRNSHCMFFHPKDSSLWMSTNGYGIVVYQQNGEVWNISENDGLSSNTVNSMVYSPQGIWAATSQGISFIRCIDDKTYDIEVYTRLNGLPTSEITTIDVHGDTLYVGSNKGLVVVNKNDIQRNQLSPRIHIIGVLNQGHNYLSGTTTAPLHFDYSKNDLEIVFKSLSFVNPSQTLYRYRMLGIDSAWTYTSSASCRYMGLKPGSYTFMVQSREISKQWGQEGASIDIIVDLPFWRTNIFIFLLSLSLSMVFFAVYKVCTHTINKRNKLIHSANLYKQQSLRQQMNPHFIFNTLGSIQFYILNKDPITSQRYLTRFAKLMRMTLNNSLTPVISLNEEIESLKTYLELEMLRFEGRFTYSINCDNLDEICDIQVPTLLIQPFVENSIWHGIMLKSTSEGHVEIGINETPNSIVITVDDNGVGRVEARRIREKSAKSGHISRGYQITQQRISLLNSMYGNKFHIVTMDKYDANGNANGTMVTITFPKGISFEMLDYE